MRTHAIGLEHVEAIAVEQFAELVGLTSHLTAGDPHPDAATQLGVARIVAAVQRFLDPVHIQRLELGSDIGRQVDVPRPSRVPGHAPGLIAVDHQRQPVGDGLADRRDHGDVVGNGRTTESDLQRLEAGVDHPLRHIDHLHGRPTDPARRVDTQTWRGAAEHSPHGLIGCLAGEIPQRQIERPGPTGVELDIGQHGGVPFEVACRLPDEVAGIVGEPVHHVTRSDSFAPITVAHSHDRHREPGSGLRIPRRREGRAKRELVMGDLDSDDLAHDRRRCHTSTVL